MNKACFAVQTMLAIGQAQTVKATVRFKERKCF
jgi:hypothetical protein